jgi:hypothetical protein
MSVRLTLLGSSDITALLQEARCACTCASTERQDTRCYAQRRKDMRVEEEGKRTAGLDTHTTDGWLVGTAEAERERAS